jgi:transposase
MAMAIERDFRQLAPVVQAELRRVAVGMVAAGKTRIEAAAAVGVNRRFVGAWVKAAAQSGEAALAGRRRGRHPGEQRALTADQESRLRGLIATRCPDQVQLPFALWTREAVRALIARETGVTLALPVVGRYLRRWGFTPQRPIRRATERREPEVRAWLETEYPAIAARAKREGGEIQWADETGLSNQANYGRSFAPQGETPVILRPATRFTLSMIASLTNRGKLRFMIYAGALNAAIFVTFLRRLIQNAPGKVFLIVDNLRVHHAQRVTDWVHEHRDRLELFYLPSYAPEHNPEEFLNNDLKQTLARRRTPKTKAALKSGLRSYMRRLQRQPAKVRAFFQAPSVRYAA